MSGSATHGAAADTTAVVFMHVICEACHQVRVWYEAVPDAYFLVPAVTPQGDIRFHTGDHNLAEEADALLLAVADHKWPYSMHSVANFQAVIEESIDPSPVGEKYYLWGRPPCPHCGKSANVDLVPGTSEVLVSVPVVMVERTIWKALTFAERRARVHAALNRLWVSYGYDPLPAE